MKKYTALTLLEMLIVLAVLFILSTISVIAYRSLVDSFSINEVSLTIAQDIRKTQRAAMLLDRESDERWLYGIGIDFSNIENREYSIFKWCSIHDYYDERQPELSGELPNLGNDLPTFPSSDKCLRGEASLEDIYHLVAEKDFRQYDNLDFYLVEDLSQEKVAFILFQAVSGKAFFYSEDGRLLNYTIDSGEDVYLNANLNFFELRLEPMRGVDLRYRTLVVTPISGIVHFVLEGPI